MAVAELGDVQLFYTDEGSGAPVLLVHGWSCDGADWSWQAPALVDAGYRVIVPDLRGFGRSSVPEGGYSPKGFAGDLARLIEKLACGPVVAIGHSMGGATVVALAVEHPALVKAIVPVDSAYGWGEDFRPLIAGLVDGIKAVGVAAADTVFDSFYTPASPPQLKAWHKRRAAGVPTQVLWKAFEGMAADFGFMVDAQPYLCRVSVPALVFRAGRSDPLAVAQWEKSVFGHPASRAVAWEGTGHFLHQERPAEFNLILLEWLAGL